MNSQFGHLENFIQLIIMLTGIFHNYGHTSNGGMRQWWRLSWLRESWQMLEQFHRQWLLLCQASWWNYVYWSIWNSDAWKSDTDLWVCCTKKNCNIDTLSCSFMATILSSIHVCTHTPPHTTHACTQLWQSITATVGGARRSRTIRQQTGMVFVIPHILWFLHMAYY